jgi:hypothetical protein
VAAELSERCLLPHALMIIQGQYMRDGSILLELISEKTDFITLLERIIFDASFFLLDMLTIFKTGQTVMIM